MKDYRQFSSTRFVQLGLYASLKKKKEEKKKKERKSEYRCILRGIRPKIKKVRFSILSIRG